MQEGFRLRGAEDVAAIEALGMDAFLPEPTPFALLRAAATARPDATALLHLRRIGAPEEDERITFDALYRSVCRAANLFRRLGVGPDESVALLMPHVPAGQVALWGAEAAARACPVNPMLRPDHLRGILRAARASVAVVCGPNPDVDIWDRAVPAIREAGCVRHILDAGAEADAPGSDGRFEDLLAAESDRFDDAPPPDRLAAFFHTGGTTGAPKLARHSHRNQAFVARGVAAMGDLGPADVVVNGFPLFHVAGSFVYGLAAIAAGAATLIPTRLGMRNRAFVSTLWRQVERHRVTCLGAVPTFIAACNAVPVDADIASLRLTLTGGSPLPAELADAFERHTGAPVRNVLGMTECAGVVTVEPFHGPRTPGSTGVRLPFTEVRAFRPGAGGADLSAPLAPGETGIIALRGPNVGPGYSDVSRNPGTFEPGGWLVSGDLGHVDAEGRVHVTGRAKDVIIRGAHNIDPAVIEDALLRHPDVLVAAAVGQPDAYAGELPVAYVTVREGSRVGGGDLARFVEPLVAEPAARPRHVTVLDALPLTPVGKIFKPALRVLAARRGVEDALRTAGIDPAACALEVSDSGATVRVAAADAERARRALLGMPIPYTISAA
ncbi:AMP-binding protein [Azospirillum sp. ST 5-10]|uniref:AMP-binding protein n=1 Tax=unclassified Azospirillum TaxID=2630922 RepID=UPI003F49F1C8